MSAILQEQRFERLGSNRDLATQVRVLTATNQNLEKLVAGGKFRKDLYFRLKVVTIQVPPLRERLDDVAELAHYFLFRFDRELGLQMAVASLPKCWKSFRIRIGQAMSANCKSAIKQAMLNASGHLVLPEFLAEEFLCADRAKNGYHGFSERVGFDRQTTSRGSRRTARKSHRRHRDRVLFTKVLVSRTATRAKLANCSA